MSIETNATLDTRSLPDAAADAGEQRTRILLAIMALASIAGYTATVALGQSIGIAAFFAIWLIPLALRPERIVAALGYWPLWLVPAVALLSTFWSRLPDGTLRNAVELIAFTMLTITMTRMLDRRTLIVSIVTIFSGIALVSLVSGRGNLANGSGTFILSGVFASKNMLALFCGIVTFTGLAGMLDREMSWWQRLICVAGCGLGAIVGILARSVGANLATGAACVTVVGLLAIGRLPTGGRRLVMIAMLGVVAMVGAAAAFVTQDDVNNLLISVGKSPTLSGRAYLWDRAGQAIAEHPLVGYGYQAFWGPQFEDALGLYRYADVASESGFHFHNLYYETAVEMGAIGVLAMGGMLVTVLLAALWRYDRKPDATAALCVAILVFFLIRAPLEVDFLVAFNLGNFLLAIVYVFSQQDKQTLARTAPREPLQFRGEAIA